LEKIVPPIALMNAMDMVCAVLDKDACAKKDFMEVDVWTWDVLIIAIIMEIALVEFATVETVSKELHVKHRNALTIVLEMEFAEIGNAFAIKVLKVLIVQERLVKDPA